MIQELDRVILTSDIPEYSLEEGDIGQYAWVKPEIFGRDAKFRVSTGLKS